MNRAREPTNPSLNRPAVARVRERGGCVSITTIAVLTHLSLSFIAQFDIKRHDINLRPSFMNPGAMGQFFNRFRNATKCRARQQRISRVILIEGKSVVQIQIDPFVTHFSATGFVHRRQIYNVLRLYAYRK